MPSGSIRRTSFSGTELDANGNRTSLEWRSTPTQANAYKTTTYALQSGTNRLASANDNTGARSFTHDGRGNLSAETRSGAVSAAVSYDGYGRLTSYARDDIDGLKPVAQIGIRL
ncbi:MAG: hypothetical protein V3V15_02935 [Sphingorhabdus sp.]